MCKKEIRSHFMCETGFLLLCDSGRNEGAVIYLFGDDDGSENGSCGKTFILNMVENEVSGDSGKIRSDYGGFGIVQDVGVHDGASLYRIFRIFESECIITPENVCIDVLFGWMNDGQKDTTVVEVFVFNIWKSIDI